MDMAVGVIIGGAFKSIVDSLVSDLFMPLVSPRYRRRGFHQLVHFAGRQPLRYPCGGSEAGAATLNYGKFITVVLNFIPLAFLCSLL